jgi:hypothetical protein
VCNGIYAKAALVFLVSSSLMGLGSQGVKKEMYAKNYALIEVKRDVILSTFGMCNHIIYSDMCELVRDLTY